MMTKQILNLTTIGLASFFLTNIATTVQNSQINTYQKLNSDQEIINQYINTNFYQIFDDDWNPGNKGLLGNKVTYDWTGTFATPTWGKLKYQIPGGYAYFMTKILYHQEDNFYPMIARWNTNHSDMTANLKIKILITFFNDYLRIGTQNKYYNIFNGFLKSNNITKFLEEVKNFSHFVRENPVQFIRNTLTNLIKNMAKDSDSYWVGDYIVDEYTKDGDDKPYDGGVNFFIYYSSRYPTFFIRLLMGGICENCHETSHRTHHFKCARTFLSERTSGGSNYLSCLQYEFSINKVELFKYRPGKDIYSS